MILDEMEKIEKDVMSGLKDFQRATVERVAQLFESGVKRVLVADEVGLGKTLVARGIIAKVAKAECNSEKGLLNVVYVCSNAGIAGQNIQKLRISEGILENPEVTRLSMQHLLIAEKKNEAIENRAYIRLIPVTPATSFDMKSKTGTVYERALMFVILKRVPELSEYTDNLRSFLQCSVSKGTLDWWIDYYFEKRVTLCNEKSYGDYLKDIVKRVSSELCQKGILQKLFDTFNEVKQWNQKQLISELREMFASISVESLDADLVIMDEFQRFKYLIDEKNSDTKKICHKMFNGNTRILLLSATPYKLYSTFDEIEETNTDKHYLEFMNVLKFLFDKDPEKMKEFETVWSSYTKAIKEYSKGDSAILLLKNNAESKLLSRIARTERGNDNDMIDVSGVSEIEISVEDIATYIDMTKIFESVDSKRKIYDDYVKSCPYPLSYMRDYKLKRDFNNARKKASENTNIDANLQKYADLLWVKKDIIRQYKKLDIPNARFRKLEKTVFTQNAHNLLWVPPSKPYWNLSGVYKGKEIENFSKTLVFSAWEMVPRMIATLLSYECERLVRDVRSGHLNSNDEYFTQSDKSTNRKPRPLLKYNAPDGKPTTMSLFTLMYPSKYLADIYNPVDYLNDDIKDIDTIKSKLKKTIETDIEFLKKYESEGKGEDVSWYYYAPMLIDIEKNKHHLNDWFDILKGRQGGEKENDEFDEDTGESTSKLKKAHLNELCNLYNGDKNKILESMGRMPSDLAEVLVDSALGSFAVCTMRTFGNQKYAFIIAEKLQNRFNFPEATAIVTNNAANKSEPHWRSVLKYCINGNMQAMLDEYYHILSDSIGKTGDIKENIYKAMEKSFALHTASPKVDLFEPTDSMKLRTHYAVNFSNEDSDDEKQVDRKNSLRNAFNSPMWPFVLATTSIGQEGLDFHNYCRRIVHWNLPSNPIDLEQREGRINRYKCLAVRQSIAKNSVDLKFCKSVWEEMFKKAIDYKPQDSSDLFPFWQLGKMQSIKIERIVPQFPFSKDILKYERLIKILSLYRLSLGQPRQEEFIDSILKNNIPQEELEKLFINLSPFYHNK